MSTAWKQDMPPPGGYAPIRYERVFQKKLMSGWAALAVYALCSAWGAHKFWIWKKYVRKLDVEKYDTLIALQPFIRAEQDRALLRQIWENREEERELMKDHEGWKVGTLYGERLYKSRPKEEFPQYDFNEVTIHRPFKEHWYHNWPDAWI